ncbi:MAG: hypothetical protein OSJ44_16390, partial [Lachnospiraceae bacterium]|nr:hypothetical protein [Lachnospiraceae bacterium]
LDDEGKEKRINYQIRKDATRLVSGIVYEKDNLWHNLDYEIKFLNGKMISVCDTLCEMLIEDEFEGITKWDGVAGNTVSQEYRYTKQSVGWIKERMIEGWVPPDVTSFDWYTDGSRFVIVISQWNTYDEFAIDLSEVEDILDSEFLEKLGR